MYVEVERVVNIVESIFRTSAALNLFTAAPTNSNQTEVSHQQLQGIIQSLLQNVKIVYQRGNGCINAQDLQIQSLLEFEKLRVKIAGGRNSKRLTATQ